MTMQDGRARPTTEVLRITDPADELRVMVFDVPGITTEHTITTVAVLDDVRDPDWIRPSTVLLIGWIALDVLLFSLLALVVVEWLKGRGRLR